MLKVFSKLEVAKLIVAGASAGDSEYGYYFAHAKERVGILEEFGINSERTKVMAWLYDIISSNGIREEFEQYVGDVDKIFGYPLTNLRESNFPYKGDSDSNIALLSEIVRLARHKTLFDYAEGQYRDFFKKLPRGCNPPWVSPTALRMVDELYGHYLKWQSKKKWMPYETKWEWV